MKRIVTALMLSFLFRCFSFFVPHLKTLSHEKKPENCVCFETSGRVSALISLAKCNIFPSADNGCSCEKKNFWQSDLLTPSMSTVEIWSTLTYTEFDCVALPAML